MFSLPDITRLNSDARIRRAQLFNRAKRINAGRAEADELCYHCNECRAAFATPWYDIFSNDAKGLVLECEECRDSRGIPEGFFLCEGCNRLMATNYTWELYKHEVEDGTCLCLPCYAQREIANEDNWIALTDEDIAVIDFEVARKAKHLIGVEMPIPTGIQFVGNVELDSATGGKLRCSSHADSTPDAGMAELREILTRAKEQGYKRALVICDGAYQYAVSIAVYVPAAIRTKQKINGRGRKGVQ